MNVGEMYTYTKGYDGGNEYIIVEKLENIIALMNSDNQHVFWVTKHDFKYSYKRKGEK